ncbi:FtsL-like putative cell division protein [Olivibacter sitiensis]|uniref:FtsL-like putative cell division protein n=1 Tax=Olivibacter sitiensis TaxID=376470 RepID=UPI0004151760|nr:FtsL-like putative cell division protein [Olivibacter sitiensis]
MSNNFRKGLSEEQQEEMEMAVEEKANASQHFLKTLFSGKILSSSTAVSAVPFIGFMAFLGILYIGNRHYAENTVREIDRLSREVKTLSWEYKSLSAELMLKSTQSEVLKKVDTLGLKELVQPPQKIVIPKQKKK